MAKAIAKQCVFDFEGERREVDRELVSIAIAIEYEYSRQRKMELPKEM